MHKTQEELSKILRARLSTQLRKTVRKYGKLARKVRTIEDWELIKLSMSSDRITKKLAGIELRHRHRRK